MAASLTKQDLSAALAVQKQDFHAALTAQDKRFDEKLNRAVSVLEDKIERSERHLRADLITYADRSVDRVTQATTKALEVVPTRTEFTKLERRVEKLETKVS